FCDGIKPRLAIVRGSPPLGGNPAALLQSHQRGIDRTLVEQHFVPAHLLNAPRDAVTVERPHRGKRLQNHQVQCSLQKIEFGLSQVALLCYYHRSISQVYVGMPQESSGASFWPQAPLRPAWTPATSSARVPDTSSS